MTFSKTYFGKGCFWEQRGTIPFNELILSWNGVRPKVGKWTFWVSLKEGEWLKYAEWASDGQRSFKSTGDFAQSYQDVVTPKELCTRFQIKVEGEDLSQLRALNVCVSNIEKYTLVIPQGLPPVLLDGVPRQSQMVLDHPRHRDLCSPTSTSTAIRYLLKRSIDPVEFAKRSHDDGFDIYGNWILNVAEAYNETGLPCHVEGLSDFTALHSRLMQGKPVVVSVKGQIAGAPKVYNAGHLICVIGYEKNKVYCIDPAFPTNKETLACYELEDFVKAWGIRRNLAYIF